MGLTESSSGRKGYLHNHTLGTHTLIRVEHHKHPYTDEQNLQGHSLNLMTKTKNDKAQNPLPVLPNFELQVDAFAETLLL